MESPTKYLNSKCKPIQEDNTRMVLVKGPNVTNVEAKFDELKYEIVHKIDKELNDSENARNYITQKYTELCNKIHYLTTEVDATVTGFRSDVKAVQKQVSELSKRVEDIDKKTTCKESLSLPSTTV